MLEPVVVGGPEIPGGDLSVRVLNSIHVDWAIELYSKTDVLAQNFIVSGSDVFSISDPNVISRGRSFRIGNPDEIIPGQGRFTAFFERIEDDQSGAWMAKFSFFFGTSPAEAYGIPSLVDHRRFRILPGETQPFLICLHPDRGAGSMNESKLIAKLIGYARFEYQVNSADR